MASFEMMVFPQLRPCLVNGEECLFHTWENFMQVIAPSAMVGGHNGGQIAYTLGIVEKADGTLMKVYPGHVRFVDSLHEEIWSGGAYRDADKNCKSNES